MIRIMTVGKVKDRRLAALIDDFQTRMRPLSKVDIVELRDSDPEREARDMVDRLGSAQGKQLVVAMDEKGKDMTSVGLSKLLAAHGDICFLIGGADGLGAAARDRSARTVRLSSMTLTHEMARLLLVEQVYRGLTILRGMPYHRG
jgi:23S rRNA (pseudouridine1915-N3)-methyltransferase